MTEAAAIQRTPTGISGFDDIALGGLPSCRSTLLSGTTGSGKTVFATEFLARGIERFGDPGVFVAFDETPANIRRNAASFGFDIARWEAEGKWVFVDASPDVGEEVPIIGTYGLGPLMVRIERAVRMVGAKRLSLDSLGAIFVRFRETDLIRHELQRLAGLAESLGVTAVLTVSRQQEYGVSQYGVEEFVLDNVVITRNVLWKERRRRTVEIVKFRGAVHRTGEWLFTIDPVDGLAVIPLAFLTPRERALQERVSLGNPGLDAMVGGGVYRDAVVLLTGPSGAGKTLAALQFADAAYRAGERCIFQTFDETRDRFVRHAAGWGFDLDAMEESGLLRLIAEYPEVAPVEDHFIRLRREIGEFAPSRIVIDNLSVLARRARTRTLLDFIVSLTALVRQREITSFCTMTASPQTETLLLSPTLEVTNLTDVNILLRYVEEPGSVQRAVAVLQSRGSAHDHAIRRVAIDGTGMHIGDPYPRILGMPPFAGMQFYTSQQPGDSGPRAG